MSKWSGTMAWCVLCGLVLCGSARAEQNEDRVWRLGNPVLAPGPSGTFDETAVKDPSIVFFENRWHLFYTARGQDAYTTGYLSAPRLRELGNAPRHELKMIRGRTRYGCAPQVFCYRPQQKWYLIFQNRNANYQPAFATTQTIDRPQSWSAPLPLLRKKTAAKWIDFWIICDRRRACLFYTRDHADVMLRTTSLESFPNGWGEARKVLDHVHEAVHVYKVKDRPRYHMIYELNQDGVRTFGLAVAKKLTGPWKKVTDHYATGDQLRYVGRKTRWTDMVSHGEAIRSGYDQRMIYDPENSKWLIQGLLQKDLHGPYSSLPWKIGTITRAGAGDRPGPSASRPADEKE
jgi:hypothetical protein